MAPNLLKRRRFLRVVSTLGLSACGAGLYTWQWEPHWTEFVHRKLPIRGLPTALAGKRLVQLSDLHIGPRVEDSFLLRTFAQVKQLAPDFVVYTGDFTSHHSGLLQHLPLIFKELPTGSLGTFGILGNHDYGPDWAHPKIASQITSLAEAAGVQILRNEVADSHGLSFVGLDDPWAGCFDAETALAKLAPGKASVVLTHNPDTADEPVWRNYQGWLLAGHTHGGQCKPPFLPPPLLPVRNRRYTAGEFDVGNGRRMYINRGIGHLLQVRFNARPEVTVFTLTTV